MRVIALEEHFSLPGLMDRIPSRAKLDRGNPSPDKMPDLLKRSSGLLTDLADGRIADMDANGISMQVLSWAGPGADLLEGNEAEAFARDANNTLAGAIERFPDRFGGFAHLPVTLPDAGATELARCTQQLGFKGAMVNGTTKGRFLDDPAFAPMLEAAEALDVPIYIHPNIPSAPVRESYYGDLEPELGFALSTYGFGWHAEVGVHVIRLILSGTLNRYPKLKLIIGHMGEFLPMTIARTETMVGPAFQHYSDRTISNQLRTQVWFTTSGIFTLPPLEALVQTLGIDHVLFGVDYPYSSNREGRTLIDMLPFAPTDAEKICSKNAEQLLRL